MTDTAIRVENIGKQYRIGVARERYDTVGEQLVAVARSAFGRGRRRQGVEDTIWALDDVSFEVARGEVLGVIGRNGAGKSTLLKILSRIVEPTTGQAEIFGRVGSLLEVGTGFEPELTGRENVYLSGAVLGMKRAEIQRRFDDIVEFAEIGKFIDTPVKRYSSGMYVRLAFAVAAHLDFDILLIDEVLAVGDAAFQEKCLGSMEAQATSGKTVLFVSHNMSSVQHLCKRGILFKLGRIAADGLPRDVISEYLSDARKSSSVDLREWRDRVTSGEARIVRIEVSDGDGKPVTGVPFGQTLKVSISAEFAEPMNDPVFGFNVIDASGQSILDVRSDHSGLRIGTASGTITVTGCLSDIGLYPGPYTLSPFVVDSAITRDVDWVRSCCSLDILPAPGPHGDLKLVSDTGKYFVPSSWVVR